MYKVVPFTKIFLPQVMQIEISSFKADMFPLSVFEDLLLNPNVLGMVALNKIDVVIGYILLRHTGTEAEVLTIAVKKTFLNQGVGGFLMEQSLSNLIAGGVNDVFLEVRPTNNNAIKLYKKFGAKYISTRKNYYENEDAHVYHLKINLVKKNADE